MSKSRRLDKNRVLETAVAIAEQAGGVGEVTLTALAAALDVRVPSLYNHVDGLAGLHADLTLLAGRMLLDSVRQEIFGKTGEEALRAMGHAYRRFAQDNAALYPLTIVAPDAHESERVALAQEWLQLLLLTMASLGLHGDEALNAIRAYRALLHGFVSLEAAGGYKMDLDRDQSFEYLLDTFIAAMAHPTRST